MQNAKVKNSNAEDAVDAERANHRDTETQGSYLAVP